MLLHYLILSFRLMIRNPAQTIINIAGLSLAITCFFVLWSYSNEGLGTDQYVDGSERTWRVGSYWRWKEDSNVGQMTCGVIPMDQTNPMLSDYSGRITYTRFLQQTAFDGGRTTTLSTENTVRVETDSLVTSFHEGNIIEADQNLFDFFSIPLRYGNRQTALAQANAVALSAHTAAKYFGQSNPVGRYITFNDSIHREVTAVFEDLPTTSHLDFTIVVSNVGNLSQWDIGRGLWGRLYVRFEQASQLDEFNTMLQQNREKYWARERAAWIQSDGDHFLQPLTEIKFGSFYYGDYFKHGSYLMLLTLRWLSLAIILVAWINYMNHTVTSINKRLKEIATRKASGALVKDAMIQFGLESLIIHAVALIASTTILQLASGSIQEILGLSPSALFTSKSLGILVSYILVCSFVVASYPASLSRSKSVKSLYWNARGFGWIPRVRSALSVFQFALSLSLIISALVVGNQLWGVLHHDLGIRKSDILVVNLPLPTSSEDPGRVQNLIADLRRQYKVTFCYSIAGDASQFRIAPVHPTSNYVVQINMNGGVDETFVPLMGLQLIAGRNFVQNDRSDVVILSRYVVERLGFESPEKAIGFRLRMDDRKVIDAEIVGVIEDYMLEPMVNYDETRNIAKTGNGDGICLTYKDGLYPELIPRKLLIQVDPGTTSAEVSQIEARVQKTFFHYNVQALYLEDYINGAYNAERHFGLQVMVLMIFAIMISCLGFFGNVSNRIAEKTKEIGIRKVHGAGAFQLGLWLLKFSTLQAAVAIAVSVPAAYFFSLEYLKRYSVVFPLSWWYFAAPPVAFVAILLATVSGIIWTATKRNPIESLRYE